MNKALVVILAIPLYFYILFCSTVFRQYNVECDSVETWKLNRVLNICTDAATAEMLVTGDLGSGEHTFVDPSLALNTFTEFFCDNYEIPLTEENRLNVLDKYVKAMLITANDGYYYLMKDNNLSLKFPYKYREVSSFNGDTHYVPLTLTGEGQYRITQSTDGKVTILGSVGAYIGGSLKKHFLSNLYTRVLAKSYIERTDKTGYNSVVIPISKTAISHTNTIENPTVFTIVDDFRTSTGQYVSAYSVGASDLREADPVVAFIDNSSTGNKYFYCYSSEYAASANHSNLRLFDTPKDAALAGYAYKLK